MEPSQGATASQC